MVALDYLRCDFCHYFDCDQLHYLLLKVNFSFFISFLMFLYKSVASFLIAFVPSVVFHD